MCFIFSIDLVQIYIENKMRACRLFDIDKIVISEKHKKRITDH